MFIVNIYIILLLLQLNNATYNKDDIYRLLNSSIHKGLKCSDCHKDNDYDIEKKDVKLKTNRLDIQNLCGSCHKNEETVYRESIHGISIKKGINESATCAQIVMVNIQLLR